MQTLTDFKVDRTLGTGSFGRVLLVQNNTGSDDFKACKIISKERVIKTRQVEHTLNEKNILFCMNCKFVVRLYDYFQVRPRRRKPACCSTPSHPVFAPLCPPGHAQPLLHPGVCQRRRGVYAHPEAEAPPLHRGADALLLGRDHPSL